LETPTIQELAKKRILKPMQRQELTASIRQHEEMLHRANEMRSVYGLEVNEADVSKYLATSKRVLNEGTPEDYSGDVKNRLNYVRKELENQLKYDILTIDEMERPVQANVSKCLSYEKQHKKTILAWRTICRTLDPDNPDPNFTNIARLRTNTPAKGDPRRYFSGYDETRWEQVEEELVEDIGDEDYLQFLQLRALRWAEANICRKLNWDKRRYAAALERFRRSALDIAPEVMFDEEDGAEPLAPLAPSGAEGAPEETPRRETKREVKSRAGKASLKPNAPPPPWVAEIEKRGLTVPKLEALCGIVRVRLYSIRAGRPIKPEEQQKIDQALADWDKAHAFMGPAALTA